MTFILVFLIKKHYICISLNTKEMKIKAYSKSELARAYAPDIDIRSALNRLSYWIRYNKKLSEELHLDGYNRYQKVFTERARARHYQCLALFITNLSVLTLPISRLGEWYGLLGRRRGRGGRSRGLALWLMAGWHEQRAVG